MVWIGLCAAAGPAFAHRDDNLNETFVFLTLGAGEFEPEGWYDYLPAQEGSGPAEGYAAAFDYGVTPRFMLDAFAGWLDPSDGAASFGRFRTEARARFGEEGDRAIDVAASFEVEYEDGPEQFAAFEAERAWRLV